MFILKTTLPYVTAYGDPSMFIAALEVLYSITFASSYSTYEFEIESVADRTHFRRNEDDTRQHRILKQWNAGVGQDSSNVDISMKSLCEAIPQGKLCSRGSKPNASVVYQDIEDDRELC